MSSTHVYVTLRDCRLNKTLSLCLGGIQTVDEVKQLIELSFNCQNVVGLFQPSSSIFYPVSVLLQDTSQLQSGQEFELVYPQSGSTVGNCEETLSMAKVSPSASQSLSLPEAIEEARHLLGNENIDIKSFLVICDRITGNGTLLNKNQFARCFKAFQNPRESYQLTQEFKLRQSKFIDLIFDSLKYDTTTDREAVIGVRDVLSMLSVLCVENLEANLAVVFATYDTNNSGFISEYALLGHLYVVFCFLFKLSQSVRDKLFHMERVEGDPRRFAREVWKSLMSQHPPPAATYDGDGVLYVTDFISTTEHLIDSGYGGLLFESSMAAALSDVDEILVDDADIKTESLTKRRAILGLNRYPATYVLEMFSDIASADGLMSVSQYQRGMDKLIMRHYNSITARERAVADLIISSMFQLFEGTTNGYCDLLNLGAGLSVYCGGNSADKARALYNLVQRFTERPFSGTLTHPQSSRVSVNRMSTVLSTIFKAAMMLDTDDEYNLEDSTFDTLAAEISLSSLGLRKQLFSEDSSDEDVNQVEFEMCVRSTFVQYFGDSLDEELAMNSTSPEKSLDCREQMKRDLTIDTTTKPHSVVNRSRENSFDGINIASSSDFDNSDVVRELRTIQRAVGLNDFPAEDLIETLGDYAYGGKMTRKSFCTVMNLIARLGGASIDNQSRILDVCNRIFNLFELDDQVDHADYAELTAGLSCLCASPFQDKLLVSFTVLDSDQDGYLSTDELRALMLSTLRVVSVCSATAADKIIKCDISLSDIADELVAEAIESTGRVQLFPAERFSLEMITQIAQDCMELAANVSNLSTPR